MTAPTQSVPSSPQVSQPEFLTDASGVPISANNPMPITGSITVTPAANQRVNAQAGDFVDGSIATLGTEADSAVTNPASTATAIALLKGLITRLGFTLAADNTNELKTSIYGKGAGAAGDTPLLLDASGRPIIGNIVQIGGQAVKLDNTNEQAVSIYGKNSAAGDTPIGVDGAGRLTALLQAVGGTALLADQSNTELRTSIYGKNATAGDLPLLLDSSGRAIVGNLVQIGGQAPTLDNTSVLAVSMRGKNSTAGDTAILLNSDGSLQNDLRKVAGNAIAPGNNAVPTLNSAATGYVSAYGSNAAALTANTDFLFKWGASGTTQVNHIMIQNNSSVNLLWDLDTATSAGSPVLSNTLGQNTLFLDVQTSTLHIQANGTPNVNGTSSGNIVVRGWL